MEVYLVGGAVRDGILNIPVSDYDWLVVGATPEELLEMGYQQIGKDFPVFLHPDTHEEYALARTERKSKKGYTGFTFVSTKNITLEEDLRRRDLTINAIARSTDGNLIDPYQGVADLRRRLLRHVSDAFTEDPLRILRVARFAASFYHIGFRISEETFELMCRMVLSGELSELPVERVWQETEKALHSQHPEVYFQVLHDCNALRVFFPEIEALFGIPTVSHGTQEIDTGIHTMMTLECASKLSSSIEIRFSALCHDLGKGLTPKVCWPYHHGHGLTGARLVEVLCHRLRIPHSLRDIAKLVAEYNDLIHTVDKLPVKKLLNLLDDIDVWRKPNRLEKIILTSESDMRSHPGFENTLYLQGRYLHQAYQVAHAVLVKEIVASGIQYGAIRKELTRLRYQAIAEWRLTQKIIR